jgi:hypothetical protein
LVVDLGLTEFAPRYPRFLMCVCNVDLFGGEAVVHVLKARPRVYINGFIIRNSHCILAQQFLGIP